MRVRRRPSHAPDARVERLELDREALIGACLWGYENSDSAAVRQRLRAALEDAGIRLLEPRAERFEPDLHVAVGEGDFVERTLQPGALDGDRLVRPAHVLLRSDPTGDTAA